MQIFLIVVFCQKMFFFFHLLQNPGIDPFTVVEIVFIVIQITDHFKIIGKRIKLNIGILQKFFNGKTFHFNLPLEFADIF